MICRVSTLYGENVKNTDELPNVHTLTSAVLKNTVSFQRKCVRMSKNRCYESPHIVTGDSKHTGIEEAPKESILIRLTERGKLITFFRSCIHIKRSRRK